jgi:pimeloyl-ACP methyl ester carboxylesterase
MTMSAELTPVYSPVKRDQRSRSRDRHIRHEDASRRPCIRDPFGISTATGPAGAFRADDLAALTAHLDLQDAVHVGHSTGGGEVVHYIARHGESRVAKAVLISAVPPLMVQTDANPGGLPKTLRPIVRAARAERDAEDIRGLPARHADHRGRNDQR